jgi:hypothetical protein
MVIIATNVDASSSVNSGGEEIPRWRLEGGSRK